MKSLLNELFNSITMEVNLEINIPLKHLTPPKLIVFFAKQEHQMDVDQYVLPWNVI